MARPNSHYRMMVEGADDGGSFLVTYEGVARSAEDLEDMVRKVAVAEGWRFVAIEEADVVGQRLGSEPVYEE